MFSIAYSVFVTIHSLSQLLMQRLSSGRLEKEYKATWEGYNQAPVLDRLLKNLSAMQAQEPLSCYVTSPQ